MTEGPTPRDPREEPGGQAPAPPPPPPGGAPDWSQPSGYQPPPQGYQAPPPPSYQQPGYQQQPPGYQPQQSSGLSENVASGLSYVFGWLTGLIFFLIDKRPEVRFHAMQSIVFAVVAMLVGWIRLLLRDFGFVAGLLWLVSLVFFFTWIFLMIQAFQGKHFKLPVIGDFAEQQAGRPA